MNKYIALLILTNSLIAQEVGVEVQQQVEAEVQKIIKHAGLTREEIALTKTQQDYIVINDIISEQQVFISIDKAMEYFVKSLNYYNRSLAIETKKAILKAKKDKKRYYVNIVGGIDIPQHTFKGRNNVYKVGEFREGQNTVLYVEPSGRIFQDHYESGDYGQLGRDGVSFLHSIKTFGATEIRKATERARKSNENYDWEVTVSFPDMADVIQTFDTYDEYEFWMNRKQYSEDYIKVKKIKSIKLSKK